MKKDTPQETFITEIKGWKTNQLTIISKHLVTFSHNIRFINELRIFEEKKCDCWSILNSSFVFQKSSK